MPWTDVDNDTLRNHHADGLSLTEAAKRMGRPKTTVAVHARKMGLKWDRTQTAAATLSLIHI